MAEIEHVSKLLSFVMMMMPSYYIVVFLSLIFFLRTFCQFCNDKMRKEIRRQF